MAKAKARNIIFIGKDGKVAITSGTGALTVASVAKLSGDVTKLIRERQAVGKKLTAALIKAKYSVTSGSSESDVLDPALAFAKLSKKMAKKKATNRR